MQLKFCSNIKTQLKLICEFASHKSMSQTHSGMRMVNNEKTSRACVPRPKGDQSVVILRTRGPSENPTTLVNILRGRYPRRVGVGGEKGG
jgi:hypothetical protein